MLRTPLAVSLALAALLAGGCSAEQTSSDPAAQERPRPRAAASPTSEPAEPSDSSGPTARVEPAEPTAATGRRPVAKRQPVPTPSGNALVIETTRGPDAHLIGAGALGSAWSVLTTGAEDGRTASRCQRATMSDIGAERTRIRAFAADDAEAAQAVSRFVDRTSAWRAERVLAAWREDCSRALRRRDAALGTVRHGVWLSVIEVAGVAAPRTRLRAALGAVEKTF